MKEKGCIFCDRESIKDDIIYETNNFFVKVGFGVAAPGHVLLIPKEHYISFADIPDDKQEEFKKIKKLVYNKVKEIFSEPFLMEYCIIHQSVPHAHIHFIPKQRKKTKLYREYKIKDLLKELEIPRNVFKIIKSHNELKEIRKKYKGYILLEDKRAYVFTKFSESFPSDNLRWRFFFNQKFKIKDIPVNWKIISDNLKEIDEIKREETKRLLKFST